MAFGGLLQALGQAFGGYATDVRDRDASQRQTMLDARAGRFQDAQMRDFDATASLRGEQQAAAADKLLSNKRAAASLAKNFPDHPDSQDYLSGGFDAGRDYVGTLKTARDEMLKAKTEKATADQATTQATRSAAGWFDTLKAANPKHALVTAGFDPNRSAAYQEEVGAANARKLQADAYHAPVGEWMETSSVGPNGRVMLMNKVTRERVEAPEGTPKAGAGNAQTAPQMAAAKANLESARKIMDDFERDYKAKQISYSPWQATKGAMASSPEALTAKGPLGGIHSYLANRAYASLQKNDPRVAQYMNAKKYVAEAILNTHKRPNQTQFEIEQELSGMGPDADALTVDMGKGRRDKMWEEVFSNPNAGAVQTAHPQQPPPGVTVPQPAGGNIFMTAPKRQ